MEEILTWILTIVIVLGALFLIITSNENAKKKGFENGYEIGAQAGKEKSESIHSKRIEMLLKQIEDLKDELNQAKSKLEEPYPAQRKLIAVNDLLEYLSSFNGKNLVNIDRQIEFDDVDRISIVGKNGTVQDGLSMIFKDQAWFIPFGKDVDSRYTISGSKDFPRLTLKISFEQNDITNANPINVFLGEPTSI